MQFAAEAVVLHRIDDHGEGAIDALVGRELGVGPFPVIDELVEGRLEGLEDLLACALHLVAIDRQPSIQLGDLRAAGRGQKEGEEEQEGG